MSNCASKVNGSKLINHFPIQMKERDLDCDLVDSDLDFFNECFFIAPGHEKHKSIKDVLLRTSFMTSSFVFFSTVSLGTLKVSSAAVNFVSSA